MKDLEELRTAECQRPLGKEAVDSLILRFLGDLARPSVSGGYVYLRKAMSSNQIGCGVSDGSLRSDLTANLGHAVSMHGCDDQANQLQAKAS